jgi:putative tricarboxylic transport membrane protein
VGVFESGFQCIFSESTAIPLMIFGIFFGIVFGCIPGLTATLGVVLLIPITYAMEPVQGMALLLGVYVGGISGGLITATLLNIPGTPSSIFTCWDAYPMAKKGKPGLALNIGVFSSLIGGLFSAVALICIAPQLAKVALSFGYWELFSLILMAFCVVIVMIEGDALRSTIGLVLGLLFSCVGLDSISGVKRLTFGQPSLMGGLASTAIMMGLFAITEIMQQCKDVGKLKNAMSTKGVSLRPPIKEMKGTGRILAFGSILGTFVGILPAVGQQTASLMTYNFAKKTSKKPEEFGKGNPEGIVASESANNAVCGGALIPLITLGIPGDMTTAALIGGLMIHGLQPGPLLFTSAPETVGSIMILFFACNLLMYVMEIGLMKVFVKMVYIPKCFLFPFIMVCCILGVFALNNRIFDIGVLVVFGIIGYLLVESDVALTPVIMGYLLGATFEKNLRRALVGSQGSLAELLNRPIAMAFIVLSALFLLGGIYMHIKKSIKKKAQA